METIGLVAVAALIFTGTIVLLVLLLGVAKTRLVPSGPVRILINDDEDKSPTVAAGSTLLAALSNQKIFLPSACGGEDLVPVAIRHLDVADDQVELVAIDHADRLEPVLADLADRPLPREQVVDRLADVQLVVGNENALAGQHRVGLLVGDLA